MTTEDRPETPTEFKIWKYEADAWNRTAVPYDMEAADRDYGAALEEIGYVRSANWGWPGAGDVEVYEWSPFESRCHEIEVTSVPDLLDLLGKLAPIVTMNLLASAAGELENLIDNAAHDANREYQRRRPTARRPR